MRSTVIAAAFVALFVAQAAAQQPLPDRPAAPAPEASAPIEQKQAWCQQYAAWYVTHTPDPGHALDARATQRYEVEFNSCTLDPQVYERQTVAEVEQRTGTTST